MLSKAFFGDGWEKRLSLLSRPVDSSFHSFSILISTLSGGTFTDIYAELPNGSHRLLKLLSVHPSHYTDAPREGIRRIIAEYKGEVKRNCERSSWKRRERYALFEVSRR